MTVEKLTIVAYSGRRRIPLKTTFGFSGRITNFVKVTNSRVG
jgi:hypothetical protein